MTLKSLANGSDFLRNRLTLILKNVNIINYLSKAIDLIGYLADVFSQIEAIIRAGNDLDKKDGVGYFLYRIFLGLLSVVAVVLSVKFAIPAAIISLVILVFELAELLMDEVATTALGYYICNFFSEQGAMADYLGGRIAQLKTLGINLQISKLSETPLVEGDIEPFSMAIHLDGPPQEAVC